METVYSLETSGKDVQEVIDTKLLPALTGMRLELAMSAMFALALQQVYPPISAEQVADGVKGMSGWLVTYVSGLDTPEGKAN